MVDTLRATATPVASDRAASHTLPPGPGLVIVHEDVDFLQVLQRVAMRAMAWPARQPPAGAFTHHAAALPAIEVMASACRAVPSTADPAASPEAPQLADPQRLVGGLVICGAAAPAGDGDPPDTERHRACIEFIDRAKAAWPHLYLLVVSAEDNDKLMLRHVEQHANARLVTVGPGLEWKVAVTDCARAAAGLQPLQADGRRTRAVLRINVFNNSEGAWSLERRGRVEARLGGPLVIDSEDMEMLCGDSADLPESTAERPWTDRMHNYAKRLNKLLFSDRNPELRVAFEDVTRESEDRQHLRLIFGLQPQNHELAVETLKRRSPAINEEQWHALNSPIVRQYEGAGCRLPLFWDAGTRHRPVNFLLVAADPQAGVLVDDNAARPFDGLPHVEAEVAALEQVVQAQAGRGVVGRVLKLCLGSVEDPQAALTAALTDGPWHVVHFAGHSVRLLARGGQPALVLSAQDGITLRAASLTRALVHTQLLFISSCRSAGPDFLQLALREAVPAVLGYRWRVNDLLAKEMALVFYRTMLEPGVAQRSMGRALMQSRKWMFRHHAEDATWASPLLLTQGDSTAAWRDPPDTRSTR